MNNPQFSVMYNGHPVAVTKLDNDVYLAQVTYKPLQLQLRKNKDGTENWVELESQLPTFSFIFIKITMYKATSVLLKYQCLH